MRLRLHSILGLVAALALSGMARALTPEIQVLEASVPNPSVADITSGSLDSRFAPTHTRELGTRGSAFWVKIAADERVNSGAIPVLSVHTGWTPNVRLYASGSGAALPLAAELPEFAGRHSLVYLLPAGPKSGKVVYARVDPTSSRGPGFSLSTLDTVLAHAATRSRMIALTFGALSAMAIASLLMWTLLEERAFILYGALFLLQALYVAYFSGEAFEWPLLSYAYPLSSYTWNVTSALSGTAACLFVREIADLRRFLPRAYGVYGWLAGAFVVVAFANAAKLIGLGTLVNALGNLLFLGSALFTLIVCLLAWQRGSRAAGWFLLAWTLLESFTIAATARLLLLEDNTEPDRLLNYGLPVSMVVAAVLIALGIADRLRDQRIALTDAERRARTDSLTGVLNRRSLVERLETSCARARARGLPIGLLFIDLDHFKEINDTFGHAAGDACLAAIIPAIQAELRQSDVIGRYGGEEFVVILSSADAAAAHPIAQRILERVAAVRVEGFGATISLTCSIGVATSDTLGVWGEHLIAQADAAVYAAKRSGRNCVQLAPPLAA